MANTSKAQLKDLSWLLRYAGHCRVNLDPVDPVQSVRQQFSKPAWRILCRSKRSDFLPILQHRCLSFTDLQAYCHALERFGWFKAPSSVLLSFVITESYLYYDQKPSVPTSQEKFIFLRLADQVSSASTRELALVRHWQAQHHMALKPQMKWTRLVERAKLWRQREKVRLTQSVGRAWHFYCRSISWRGHEIVPLDTPLALFDEAMAMSTCLYNLRYLCCRESQASRFFSLRQQGARVATFELIHEYPSCCSKGWEQSNGRWILQDVRLSFNRLPSTQLVGHLVAFTAMYNIWASRPQRQPQFQINVGRSNLCQSSEVRCS